MSANARHAMKFVVSRSPSSCCCCVHETCFHHHHHHRRRRRCRRRHTLYSNKLVAATQHSIIFNISWTILYYCDILKFYIAVNTYLFAERYKCRLTTFPTRFARDVSILSYCHYTLL